MREAQGKSAHNNRDGRQQRTSEQRIRLVIPRLPLGHESSKTPEFAAKWMVNKEKQALQKLSGAVHADHDSALCPPLSRELARGCGSPGPGHAGITLYQSRLRWQRSGSGKGLICGGPCRGRTYGPLIKSEAGGLLKSLMDGAIPRLYYTPRW